VRGQKGKKGVKEEWKSNGGSYNGGGWVNKGKGMLRGKRRGVRKGEEWGN